MKNSVKYSAILLAAVGMSFFAMEASAASLQSPRHGQQTVDGSGGPASDAPMGMMHQGGNMPMMQGADMQMMQNCRERIADRSGMSMPGKMGMGHRSNMHEQMRRQMSECMSNAGAGQQGSGGMMMQR